jgi:hypothetical protein
MELWGQNERDDHPLLSSFFAPHTPTVACKLMHSITAPDEVYGGKMHGKPFAVARFSCSSAQLRGFEGSAFKICKCFMFVLVAVTPAPLLPLPACLPDNLKLAKL